jgi:hypothetical protein
LFDAKLTSYARLAASISRGGTNDDDLEAGQSWREAESEVEDLLEKVRFPVICASLPRRAQETDGCFAMR